MTWNYRIVLHDDHKNPWLGLHEVNYDKPDGNITGWSGLTQFVCDADLGAEDIIGSLERALDSAKKHPVLKVSDLAKDLEAKVDEP